VDYPTVLVANGDEKVRNTLVDCLQRSGFHVLEADDWAHVLYWIRVHSRPIHLVLTEVSKAELMPMLKKHRSELQVVFVKEPVDADQVLARVREILGSPTPPPSPPSIR
jgi:DNA-binding NtrC family response regulator